MSRPRRLPPRDATGRAIAVGDCVRVVGVPALPKLPSWRETRAVFAHIVGRYYRVDGFGRFGHAELMFRIRKGRAAGLHIVEIEPHLLRLRRSRAAMRSSSSRARRSGAARGTRRG